jgi:hypothetical protein
MSAIYFFVIPKFLQRLQVPFSGEILNSKISVKVKEVESGTAWPTLYKLSATS